MHLIESFKRVLAQIESTGSCWRGGYKTFDKDFVRQRRNEIKATIKRLEQKQ